MKKITTILFAMTFSAATLAEKVEKVIWLTTSQMVNESSIGEAKRAAGGSQFQYFLLDESKNIRTYFESQFPKSMLNEPVEVKNAYLKKHIFPRISSYAPELMRSEMGIALSRMYRIDRLPAVIINDQYVSYGLTVSEAMTAFYRYEKK
jgi:hypothetical protein